MGYYFIKFPPFKKLELLLNVYTYMNSKLLVIFQKNIRYFVVVISESIGTSPC